MAKPGQGVPGLVCHLQFVGKGSLEKAYVTLVLRSLFIIVIIIIIFAKMLLLLLLLFLVL